MDRYTVDLDALSSFVDRLARFNARAEQISHDVDECIAELHQHLARRGLEKLIWGAREVVGS